MLNNQKTNSLAVRQAKTVFLVSVTLGLCFSFYQILMSMHQEQQNIEQRYRFELLQGYSNASLAAYHLNAELAEQVATSLMMDDTINKVRIIDDFGDVLAEQSLPSNKRNAFYHHLSQYFIPAESTYSTVLHQPNSNTVVGTLTLTVDGQEIARQFVAESSQILLFDLLRNVLLASILLIFFYNKLSKPLVLLIDWVSSLKKGSHVLPPQHFEDNELGKLTQTFHTIWQERELAERQLNQLAYYDELTGLANRSLLLEKLEPAITDATTHNHTGALIYVDLDRFKTINDSLGHTVGDNLVRAIAQRISANVNQDVTAARLGGDEFAILLPKASFAEVNRQAQALLALNNEPYDIDGHILYCTVSLGIALFPNADTNSVDLLRQADTALYKAKANGRNQSMLYQTEMQAQVASFLETEKGLHEALDNQQLELFYQPQVNDKHEIIGVEALIRWNHPDKGLLPPGVFMPVAEETGQIINIGKWIINQAFSQFAQWQRGGLLPHSFKRLAINISPLQFAQHSFVSDIVDALKRANISGDNIELEITENLLLENVESAVAKMSELKQHGLKISIDDFGTGYSSLRYLKHLSADVLKIDRSFVTQLHLDENDQAIVDTIIITARKLNLEVIAEGVEDKDELTTLKQLGCDQFQGYLFDKPLPEAQLIERFKHCCYRVNEKQAELEN
ncbi:putative bifunctional diguanylate cyclase/phosphodiesterase [Vibrio intestinalis]|uniref:putative bifunctional diguanylate cyclase/phosphodiesterase n=1 Tax=Vibrio intestinalis TaxID=2933291 RepID=UPI0021A89074|nr:EAL domain-containing protein [Vibrio intestinalis]